MSLGTWDFDCVGSWSCSSLFFCVCLFSDVFWYDESELLLFCEWLVDAMHLYHLRHFFKEKKFLFRFRSAAAELQCRWGCNSHEMRKRWSLLINQYGILVYEAHGCKGSYFLVYRREVKLGDGRSSWKWIETSFFLLVVRFVIREYRWYCYLGCVQRGHFGREAFFFFL